MAYNGKIRGATWRVHDRSSGSTPTETWRGKPYRARIVLHDTEGLGWTDNPERIDGHAYPPHSWYNWRTRKHVQSVLANRGAFALEQSHRTDPGWEPGVVTNRAGRCLQVELEGFVTDAWADEALWRIAEDVMVPYVEAIRAMGEDIDLDQVVDPPPPGTSMAYRDAPIRLKAEAWRDFNGVVPHYGTYRNRHWDTGYYLRVRRLCQFTKQLLNPSPVDLNEDEIVPIAPQPRFDHEGKRYFWSEHDQGSGGVWNLPVWDFPDGFLPDGYAVHVQAPVPSSTAKEGTDGWNTGYPCRVWRLGGGFYDTETRWIYPLRPVHMQNRIVKPPIAPGTIVAVAAPEWFTVFAARAEQGSG